MNKLLRRVLFLGLLLTLVLGLTACTKPEVPPVENPTDNVTYTITVTAPEGDEAILSGIKVALKKDGAIVAEKTLDSEYKAVFELEAGIYNVTLVENVPGILTGFTYTEEMVTATSTSATLAITRVITDDPDPNEGNTIDYILTVLLPDETPVAGVMAQLCGPDDNGVEQCHPATTDENGVASWKLVPGEYEVHIEAGQNNYPEGYHFDDTKYTMGRNGGELTVYFDSLTPETVEYTVTVVLPDNATPVVDVEVKLTNGTASYTAATDGNGVAIFDIPAAEYAVGIDKAYWPEGFAFRDTRYTAPANGGAFKVQFEEAEAYSVTLIYQYENGATAPAANLEVSLWREWRDADSRPHYEEDFALATTDADGVARFSTLREIYQVHIIACPAEWGYPETLCVEPSGSGEGPHLTIRLTELGTGLYDRISVVEGTTYTFTATEQRKSTFYNFDTKNRPGYYVIESFGSADLYVKQYTGTLAYVNATPIAEDDNSGEGSNFRLEFLIEDQYVTAGHGNVWVFEIGLNGEATAATATFRISYDHDYFAPTTVTVRPRATQISDKEITTPANASFTYLDYKATLVKDSEGYYHVGSASGPYVLATVDGTKYLPQGMENHFSTAIEESEGNVTFSTGQPDENNVITRYNLTDFFGDYIAAANSDGLVYLTEELAQALQQYAIMNGIFALPELEWPRTSEQLFLFACGYFA